MSATTYINVSFPTRSNSEIAVIAQGCLNNGVFARSIDAGDRGAALAFLKDLGITNCSKDNPGTEGGLFVWSYSINGSDMYAFIKNLYEFFYEILTSGLESGPFYSDRVIVIYEHEHVNHAECYEIYFEGRSFDIIFDLQSSVGLNPATARSSGAVLKINHHVLPFSWMAI